MEASVVSKRVPVLVLIAFAFSIAPGAQSVPGGCRGLHADITAQLTRGYSAPSVQVAFLLLNDSDTTLNPEPESWRLVIDDKPLEDSGILFGNGPAPTGGYGSLGSGRTFQFGKALPILQYFPEQREYRLSWRGKHFQSPTIVTRIPTKAGQDVER
jgi:hypothetical protein